METNDFLPFLLQFKKISRKSGICRNLFACSPCHDPAGNCIPENDHNRRHDDQGEAKVDDPVYTVRRCGKLRDINAFHIEDAGCECRDPDKDERDDGDPGIPDLSAVDDV